MKITKQKPLVENKTLLEDEDPTVREVAGDRGIEVDVKMTDSSSSAKPASAAEATKIKNALTDILDRALEDAEYALEEDNLDSNCNVLVLGLPGSSKTATIRNWCLANNCNLYYLDAKNPDLQLLTSGASSIDKTDPDHPKVNTAYSNALAKLDRPRSVLFLDELNRQVREYMRGSLLTLVADRRVAGEDKEGFRFFPNLLFTVAAINPTVEGDRGATELNPAEDRRFYYFAEFHSEVATTNAYINGHYDKVIKDYVSKHTKDGEKLNSKDIERINSFCLRQWIGNKLINSKDFHYTTVAEYTDADREKGKIVCQSVITELVDHSRGDIDRLITDIKASRLTSAGKTMLINILTALTLPNVDDLRRKKARELGLDLSVDMTKPEEVLPPVDSDDGFEDVEDSDFDEVDEADTEFEGSAAASETKAKEAKKSDAAGRADLGSMVSGWLI